jgi:anti-sigma B factor antagonist
VVAVQVRVVDGLTLLTVGGELDLAAVPALRHGLSRSTAATRPDVAVDMRAVTFLDCSTLGVLLEASGRVRTAGGCLRLAGDAHGPLRLVRRCRLDGVLCLHDSLAAATGTACDRHVGQTPTLPSQAGRRGRSSAVLQPV